MAKDEIGRVGGFVAYVAVIAILVILLGVAALIVVNALKASPWGTFTIAMTMPIALLMGVYLRRIRPGKVLEVSALGFVLVLAAIWGGQYVSQNAALAGVFTFSASTLAILIMVYGFAASALPVWLLLAPRDYLSTFVKLGTIACWRGDRGVASHAAHAGADSVCRWYRSGVRGEDFSICVYHDCLRSDQWVSCTDLKRNYSEADCAGDPDAHGGIWRDDGGVSGSGDGDYRGMCDAAGDLLRH